MPHSPLKHFIQTFHPMKGKNLKAWFDHETHAKHSLSIPSIGITPKDIEFLTLFYDSNFMIFAKSTIEACNTQSNIFPKLPNIPKSWIEAPNKQWTTSTPIPLWPNFTINVEGHPIQFNSCLKASQELQFTSRHKLRTLEHSIEWAIDIRFEEKVNFLPTSFNNAI